MYLEDIFTVTVNMAGLPGISVPAGLDKDGLPLGLQIIGRAFDEETMLKAAAALEKADPYPMSDRDRHESEWQFTQLKGQFLIDTSGVIRWANIEGAREGMAELGKFPTYDELLAAAQATAAV